MLSIQGIYSKYYLLLKNYNQIHTNHLVIVNNNDIDETVKSIKSIDGFWIRFQYLSLDTAKLLYNKLKNTI